MRSRDFCNAPPIRDPIFYGSPAREPFILLSVEHVMEHRRSRFLDADVFILVWRWRRLEFGRHVAQVGRKAAKGLYRRRILSYLVTRELT